MNSSLAIKNKIGANHFVSMSLVPLQGYTAEDMFKVICKFFKVELVDIKGSDRFRELCDARRCFIYLAEKYLYPIPGSTDIGRYIDKDHATVIYHLNKTLELIEGDKDFKETINSLELELIEFKIYNVSLNHEGDNR